MSIIELNSDSYSIQEILHGMKRASTCRFRPAAGLADATPLADRQQVKFTLSGVVVFAGRILPASRQLGASVDEVGYMASDVTEYLATNPIAEVNEWYNRSRDQNIYPYPTGAGIRTIIETELASIIGVGKPIGATDWTNVPADTQDLVVYNFQTRGKTWLGLLEAIAAEVPTLAWWYDPSTTSGSSSEGGTLRFYDLSKTSGTTATAVVARRDGVADGNTPNVESTDLTIDISQSYDKLTIHGWGDMTELLEEATAGWDYTKDGGFTGHYDPTILRDHPSTPGKVQQFTPDAGGGSWSTVSDTSSSHPWFATSQRSVNRDAYRKYQVTKEIVDVRLTRDDTVSPPRYVSAERSMWVYTLAYSWNAGPIAFPIDAGYYVGALVHGTKFTMFTNGIYDDFGDVTPDASIYPDYPTVRTPRTDLGTPAQYEKEYFTLQAPRVIRTNYSFTSVSPSATDAADYANLPGSFCFCYWPVGSIPTRSDVWMLYTGRDELSVVVEDAGLGYSKHKELWDQRFFKYTNIDGDVVRDDTAMLQAYADALFAFLSRKRVYGTISVVVDPSQAMTKYAMGTFVRLRNWGGAGTTYDVPAIVQSLNLTEARDSFRVVVGFDSPNTFHSLDISNGFRQYFEANQINGTGGSVGNGSATGGGGGGGGGGSGGGGGGSGGSGGGSSPGGDGGSDGGWGGGWASCCDIVGTDAVVDGSGGTIIPP